MKFFDLEAYLTSVVDRYRASRRTFTESEAFQPLWDAGFEWTPGLDPRFQLARDADGKSPESHWCLSGQTVANNLLLEERCAGTWDGHNLDVALERLDQHAREEGVAEPHHVFCEVDERFEHDADGVWHLADDEHLITLTPSQRRELDKLAPSLWERWRATGASPWTLRRLTEELESLGWKSDAPESKRCSNWLLVRAWLEGALLVRRVGADAWVLADAIPTAPHRSRLQVLPVRDSSNEDCSPKPDSDDGAATDTPCQGDVPLITSSPVAPPPSIAVVPLGRGLHVLASWTVTLRTVHLVEGFVPVESAARAAYPPSAHSEGDYCALRGQWFQSGDTLWVWLDRAGNRLFGDDLKDKLAWCEAGQKLRIDWNLDLIRLSDAGFDVTVSEAEQRLVDVAELAKLRGGIGESYRRSLEIILGFAGQGLTVPEVVERLSKRQGHNVHPGTVRALLQAARFERRARLWFPSARPVQSATSLRRSLATSLIRSAVQGDAPEDARDEPSLEILARTVHDRLRNLRPS